MNKSIHISTALLAAALALAGATALIAIALPRGASANPSDFINRDTCKTAAATTSVAYMTPGTATTTVTCPFGVSSYLADSATLLLQVTGSSTASKIHGSIEYSVNGVDWFAGVIASSSLNFAMDGTGAFDWTFASSSIGGAPIAGSNNRAYRSVELKSPTPYVRVILSVPVGAANAGVWAQIVGRREI